VLHFWPSFGDGVQSCRRGKCRAILRQANRSVSIQVGEDWVLLVNLADCPGDAHRG
jgi:hypothetical protein